MSSLAIELFRELKSDFFRVLTGTNALIYVDVLDALETEATQRNEGMSREEALAIVGEVLAQHPDFQPDENTSTRSPDPLPLRERTRLVLDRLIHSGWLKTHTGTDWQRTVYFDEHGITLLTALRKIAYPDVAVFTDKLVGVCATLANAAELSRQPWEHMQVCRDNAREGLSELRGLQKSVERFIGRQLEAQTLGENLSVVFDQYAEQVGHTCYAELVRSQLPARLGEARDRLQDILDDTDLLHRMQAEALRRDSTLDASAAMAHVRGQLDDLARALETVLPLADAIDARTAEFTRRSLARFRYLQDVIGERRGQMKELFENLNRSFAGRRFVDLEEAPALPLLRLPDARLLAGRDSLYQPPRRRTMEENLPVEDDASDELREQTRLQMESAMRDSLTVNRANRFIERLPGGKGVRIVSGDFPIHTEDDLPT